MMQKSPPWRSKKYLAWIRTLPCCICGAEAEPHHIKGVGKFSGAGMKASDILAMPLCHAHHEEVHRDYRMRSEQYEYICRTVERAVKEGVLVVSDEQDKPCYVCQKKITGYGE